MLWVPQEGLVRVQTNTPSIGTPDPGAVVTTHATVPGTKGADVELIASTLFDAYYLTIIASHYALATFASQGCLDILTGTDPEEVLIADLLMGFCGGDLGGAGAGPKRWDFPLYIPAGTKLAARAAGQRLASSVMVQVWLRGGDGSPKHQVGEKVTTYGVSAPPAGTTTGSGNQVAGPWAQIVAATSETHIALVPSLQLGPLETVAGNRGLFVELGLGAAAAEEVIAGPYIYETDTTESMGGPQYSDPCILEIPAASRLAMRVSVSATDAVYEGAIHAVS